MYKIIETSTKFAKKAGTKNAYKQTEQTVNEITEKQHQLTTCEDTVKWFRRCGGSETVQRSYTNAGYKVTKLISTSPDRETKHVREYKFLYVPTKSENITFENLSLLGKYNSLSQQGKITDELREKFNHYNEVEDEKNLPLEVKEDLFIDLHELMNSL